jgi:superfamily II DNA or RNA helicase
MQAPTGSGKTKIAAAIVDSAATKRNKVAFVVPSIGLIDQTVEQFYGEGIRGIGVIQANHHLTDWSQPIQVASIQTIRSRKAYPEAQIVIFDECHTLHQAHKDWLHDEAWRNVPMIGLSATPWTRGLKKYFDTLLKVIDTKSLIEQGYLSKFRVFATGHPDLSRVRTVAGDYHEGELSDAMQKGTLTADIIKTYKQKWGKGKTLCFGVDKAHAKSIQERFEFEGIACGYQDADTTADERREIKRKFHSGEYEVVSNIQTLTTGVDWDVRCLILARPTRSEMLYVQIIGRALRTAPGKDDALILDHSDSTSRLGFVTGIDHDELSNGQPVAPQEKREILPKECKECTFLKPPRTSRCPNCGHEVKKPVNMLCEDDGELVEITPGTLIKINNPKKVWTELEKMVFYRELLGYAEAHGFRNGWAWHKYKEKFGEAVPRHFGQLPAANRVSPGMELWVRSCNIRWRKSRQPEFGR